MKDMKIGTRLLLLLALLVSFTVIVGVVGNRASSADDKMIDVIYSDHVVQLQHMKAISDAYGFGIVDAAHRASVGKISSDAAIASIDSAERAISTDWALYRPTIKNDQEKTIAARADGEMKEASRAIAQLRMVLKTGSTAALTSFIRDS